MWRCYNSLSQNHTNQAVFKAQFNCQSNTEVTRCRCGKMCKLKSRRTPQNFEIAARAGGRRGPSRSPTHHIHSGVVMTVTKRMLLGSVAALTATSSTQAADLPVKAKPVEYVKICSLYGEGFYYIPGTDICLKIGGYVQADYGWNAAGNGQPHYNAGNNGSQDRSTSPYSSRQRAHFNFDSRTQTVYGTLRTYVAVHIENLNQGSVTVNPSRAFIQWAGFTFGHTKSFTDVPGTPGADTFRSLFQQQAISDTGA